MINYFLSGQLIEYQKSMFLTACRICRFLLHPLYERRKLAPVPFQGAPVTLTCDSACLNIALRANSGNGPLRNIKSPASIGQRLDGYFKAV